MKISIVTISYNQSGYLPDCLASVGCQLIAGDIHFLVDPGSKDGSQSQIVEYCKKTSGAKFSFELDAGPADGLNKGFSHVDGDILAYLNADDFLLPGALMYVRQFFASHPEIDILIGGIKISDSVGKLRARGRVSDLPSRVRLISGVFQYYQQATFFRREIYNKVNGFNVDNRTCWDRELVVDMALAGARFMTTSKPLAVFRLHANSITGAGTNHIQYKADKDRLQKQVEGAFGNLGNTWIKTFLLLEARFNPVRILKQFRSI